MEAQEASGKQASVYCREQRIGKASFYAWKRRLAGVRARLREVKFVELKTVESGAIATRPAIRAIGKSQNNDS